MKGNSLRQWIVTLDMEGVLTPEIWIAVAEATKIKGLRLTTRDIEDYDQLMRYRLRLLEEHNIGISFIQKVIGELEPLPGALEFLNKLREDYQVIILSDTFEEFAKPLLRKLGFPTLLCHRLIIVGDKIVDYVIRIPDQKRLAVKAFKSLNYSVLSVGDSFNDIGMLQEADIGLLFRAPMKVKEQYPQFLAIEEYMHLLDMIKRYTQKTNQQHAT